MVLSSHPRASHAPALIRVQPTPRQPSRLETAAASLAQSDSRLLILISTLLLFTQQYNPTFLDQIDRSVLHFRHETYARWIEFSWLRRKIPHEGGYFRHFPSN
jgi:hypothetical protein